MKKVKVGIVLDEITFKKDLIKEFETINNWKILSLHKTKVAAENALIDLRSKIECEKGPCGNGPRNALWKVYYFEC